jgi:hypothetical protein
MVEVLRRAANAYNNVTYEAAACKIYGTKLRKNMLNLLVPSKFPEIALGCGGGAGTSNAREEDAPSLEPMFSAIPY